jgi:hypothetical protein
MGRGSMRLLLLILCSLSYSMAIAETCGSPTPEDASSKWESDWFEWKSCTMASDCTVIDNRDWHCVNNLLGEPFIPVNKNHVGAFCRQHRKTLAVSSSVPTDYKCGGYLIGAAKCEERARSVLKCVGSQCTLTEELPEYCFKRN